MTCYLRTDGGFWLGFIVLAPMLFTVEVLIRASWHALKIGWHTASDKNGDLEQLDRFKLRQVLKELKAKTRQLIREQESRYHTLRKQSVSLVNQIISESEMDEPQSGKNNHNNNHNTNNNNDSAMPTHTIAGSREIKIINSEQEAKNERLNENATTLNNGAFVDLFTFDPSEIKEKLQESIHMHQAVILGDFFVGTCWRLQTVTCVLSMSVLGAYLTDITIIFQFIMRYMAISGIIWNFIYFVFTAIVSFYARYTSWNKVHPEMPKWTFFVFIDASDYDVGKSKKFSKYPWFLFKSFVAFFCFFLFFVSIITGLIFTDDENNGLFYFIALVLFSYYFFNTLVACKPYALMALWTDNIPAPSVEYFDRQKRIAYVLSANSATTAIAKDEVHEMTNNLAFWNNRNGTGQKKLEVDMKMSKSKHIVSTNASKKNSKSNSNVNKATKSPSMRKRYKSSQHTKNINDDGEEVKETKINKLQVLKESAFLNGVFDGTIFSDLWDSESSSEEENENNDDNGNDDNGNNNGQTHNFQVSRKAEEMINRETGRVYSEFKNFTYRNVVGYCDEYGVVNKEDAKYSMYLKADSRKEQLKGYYKVYNDKYHKVFENYTHYWLDIYRPYDEYDIEWTVYNKQFIFGFHCWRSCCKDSHDQRKQKRKKIVKNQFLHYSRCKRMGMQVLITWHNLLQWCLDRICNIMLFLFSIIVLFGLYYLAVTLNASLEGDSNAVYVNTSSITSNSLNIQQYGMCDTIFHDVDEYTELSVLDMGILAEMAYQIQTHDLNQMVSTYFDDEYEVIARRDVEPVFFHIRHKVDHMDIIAGMFV